MPCLDSMMLSIPLKYHRYYLSVMFESGVVSVEVLHSRVEDLVLLDEEKKFKFFKLLCQFHHLFNKYPGLTSKYFPISSTADKTIYKFCPLFSAPCEVTAQPYPNCYTLTELNSRHVKGNYNNTNIKLYYVSYVSRGKRLLKNFRAGFQSFVNFSKGCSVVPQLNCPYCLVTIFAHKSQKFTSDVL